MFLGVTRISDRGYGYKSKGLWYEFEVYETRDKALEGFDNRGKLHEHYYEFYIFETETKDLKPDATLYFKRNYNEMNNHE